jgi:transcriptional regulator with XRE-family HTH domain
MKLSETLSELRRKAGYSQEELAERLGVSRQSISKWESGASIPEVDKLIALSKLFHVSLNDLLGVEPSGSAADGSDSADSPAPEPSEAQMKRMGDLLTGYLRAHEEEQRRRSKKRRIWVVLLLAVCAIWLFRTIDKMDQMRNEVNNLQYQVNTVNGSVQSQLGDLTDRIENILEKQNSIVADSSVEILETDLRNNRIVLLLRAAPKSYTDGMVAEFYLEGSDFDPMTVPGTLTAGNFFEAKTEIPFSDLYRCSVRFTANGEIKTQLLDLPVSNIKETFQPDLWAHYIGSMQGVRPGSLYESEQVGPGIKFDGSVEINWATKSIDGTENLPVSGELTVCADGEKVLSRPLTFDSKDSAAYPNNWSVPLQETFPCAPGDTVEIWLRMEDSYGIRYDCLVQRFTINNEYNPDIDMDSMLNGISKTTYPWER